VLLCALSLPLDAVRKEVYRALERRWEEGRARLVGGSGTADLRAIRDPAVLVALKCLPRFEEDLKPAKRSRRSVSRTSRSTRARANPAVQAKAAERKARFELTKLSAELALDFNQRFYAAANSRALPITSYSEAGGGADSAPTDAGPPAGATPGPTDGGESAPQTSPDEEAELEAGDLGTADEGPADDEEGADALPPVPEGQRVRGVPFPLHRGAEVLAEYHLEWPQDLAPRLPHAALGPLTVHYVRLETKARFGALHGYYRRQLDRAVSRYVERGKWLDAFEPNDETGLCTSTDLFVTGTDYLRATAKAPDERLVVEILIVTASDPRNE
jgi:hypothetical protein